MTPVIAAPPDRPGRRPAAHVRRQPRRASCRSSPTRTSSTTAPCWRGWRACSPSRACNTLVVDAADTAPEPGELAFIDLGACVEPLSPQLAYLAARGLPMQHVDTHGSCASFIPRMMNVVYDVDVVVMHAEARVLARMLGEQPLRPVLLASGAEREPHARLRRAEAAGAAPGPDELRPGDADGQGPRPDARADRHAAWPTAPTVSSAPRCTTAPSSTPTSRSARPPAPT